MNLAAAMLGRDFTCGNSQWSSGHYFSGLHRSVCRSGRDSSLRQSSLYTPHHPRHFWEVKSAARSVCFYCLEFIFLGFFCSFFNLVFGRGATLLRRVWGKISRMFKVTLSTFTEGGGNVVAYLQNEYFYLMCISAFFVCYSYALYNSAFLRGNFLNWECWSVVIKMMYNLHGV